MARTLVRRDCWLLLVFFAAALVASAQAHEEARELCNALRFREVDSPELYARLNASSHLLVSRGVRVRFDPGQHGTLFHCLAHRWLNTSGELLDFMLAGAGPEMATSMLNDRSNLKQWTPVMVAASHGLIEAVSAMVTREADWTLRSGDSFFLDGRNDLVTLRVVTTLHTKIAVNLLSALSNATTASGEALLTSEEQRVDPENELAVFKVAQRVAERIRRDRNLVKPSNDESDETDNEEL